MSAYFSHFLVAASSATLPASRAATDAYESAKVIIITIIIIFFKIIIIIIIIKERAILKCGAVKKLREHFTEMTIANDSIVSVSYTHLTLPTIYSV